MVPKGRCHLCGENKGLTYEHVPARSSFNAASVEMFGFQNWIERGPDGEMSGGQVKERGAGAHTLCYRCNTEITGDHYVAELQRWTSVAMGVAHRVESEQDGNAVELTIARASPARLLKQIIAMLASVNSVALLDHHRPLREYVMDPEAVGLPDRYQFYLQVTHPTSSIARYGGLTCLLAPGTWCGTWLTDLVWPPLGYVMTVDEPKPFLPMGNISHFSKYAYDDRVEVTLRLPILVGDQPFPGEFSDPIPGGALAKQSGPFPTKRSARTPLRVTLADGYTTDDAELTLPLPYADWTGAELHELLTGMLRVICVARGQQYRFEIRWSEEGTVLAVTSGRCEIVAAPMAVPPSAISEFVGADTIPKRGYSTRTDTMRFKEDEPV